MDQIRRVGRRRGRGLGFGMLFLMIEGVETGVTGIGAAGGEGGMGWLWRRRKSTR